MGPDPLELHFSEDRAVQGKGGQLPKDGEGSQWLSTEGNSQDDSKIPTRTKGTLHIHPCISDLPS